MFTSHAGNSHQFPIPPKNTRYETWLDLCLQCSEQAVGAVHAPFHTVRCCCALAGRGNSKARTPSVWSVASWPSTWSGRSPGGVESFVGRLRTREPILCGRALWILLVLVMGPGRCGFNSRFQEFQDKDSPRYCIYIYTAINIVQPCGQVFWRPTGSLRVSSSYRHMVFQVKLLLKNFDRSLLTNHCRFSHYLCTSPCRLKDDLLPSIYNSRFCQRTGPDSERSSWLYHVC